MSKEIHPTHSDEVIEAIREEILEEIADLAEYARQGKVPPHCRGYRFKVNNQLYEVFEPTITGRQVLSLAGLVPPERHTLWVKIAGERPQKVKLNEEVNLRAPGIEKFKALPNDQTEG